MVLLDVSLCLKCQKHIGATDTFKCFKCYLPIHTKCIILTHDELKAMKAAMRQLLFFCFYCVIDSNYSLKELKQSICELKNNHIDLARLEKSLNINKKMDDMESKLSSAKCELFCNKPDFTESVIVELNERSIRRKNITLFSVDKDTSLNAQERLKQDEKLVLSLIKTVSPMFNKSFWLQRLGKHPILNKNHPIKVICSNEEYAQLLQHSFRDGRINLVELAKILNVNVNYVMGKISSLEELLPGCIVIMGQLISRDYQKTIAQEINDRLQSTGQVTVGELTKLYDLPGDFLEDVIDENLGNVINAKQDKLDARILYTEQFVNKNKSVLRGTLRALTKPTQVSTILLLTNFKTERDFYRTFDYLSEDKDLCGVLTGRQGNSSFIPHVHTKHQNNWVDNFYKQNGYLEYDALTRLGISDPVLFVRRHFPGIGFLELPSCIIGPQLLGQVDAAVNDTLLSGMFLDVTMLVPSVMGPSDVSKILEEILKKNKSKAVAHIFSDTVIVTETFLQTVCQPLQEEVLKEKAEKAVSSGAYIMAHTEHRINTSSNFIVDTKTEKREERRKKATSGKSGGGAQGRETKMKSTKKKYVKGRGEPVEDSGSDTEPVKKPGALKLDLITVKEIEEWLMENQQMQDLVDIEGIVKEISKHLQPQLNKKAMELASEAYERTLVSSVSQRKQLHGDLQERIDSWQMEMKLSERGLKLFPFEDTRIKLSTHLLKTTGTEVANALCLYVSEDPTLPTTSKELTPQMRKKIISELPGDTKVVLTTLNNSLSSGSVEEFFNALEPALRAVGLLNRKIDKKKEKQFLQSKREKLLTEVSTTDNPANLLHSGLLLVFQMQTQSLLSASGKFVPAILNFLQPQLPAEFFTKLHQFQELVLKLLTVGDDQEAETKLKGELNERMLALKESIVTYRKTTPATDQNG